MNLNYPDVVDLLLEGGSVLPAATVPDRQQQAVPIAGAEHVFQGTSR